MAVTVAQVKDYLRIPYNDDDNFITLIIQGGKDYLTDAIDNFSELYSSNDAFARKADLWILTQYIPDMYDKREGGLGGPAELGFAARSMLTQLQMYEYEEVTTND